MLQEGGLVSRAARKSGVVLCVKPHRAGEHQTGSCGHCVQTHVFWPGRKMRLLPRVLSFEIYSLCSICRMVLTPLFHLSLATSLWGTQWEPHKQRIQGSGKMLNYWPGNSAGRLDRCDCKVDGLTPRPGFFPLCQVFCREGEKWSRSSTLRNKGD